MAVGDVLGDADALFAGVGLLIAGVVGVMDVDGPCDASAGLRWPRSAQAAPPPPPRMIPVTAAITSHLRRLRFGRLACPGSPDRPPEMLPAEASPVGWPPDGNVGTAVVGAEEPQPTESASPPGATVAAGLVAGEVDRANGSGGDIRSGVASPPVSMPSRASGAPQIPQNTASARTGCPFMHVGTRIPFPTLDLGSVHARAILADYASYMTKREERARRT